MNNTIENLPSIVKSRDVMNILGIERNSLNKLLKNKELIRHPGFAGIRFNKEQIVNFVNKMGK